MHKIGFNIVDIEGGGKHILIECKIESKKAILLIDTGASNSVFDLDYDIFDRKDFSLVSDEITSSGFNSTIDEIFVGNIQSLKISRFSTAIENAIFTSLDHINKLYNKIDLPKINGILGCDFLLKYNAVIDFSKKMLFLKK